MKKFATVLLICLLPLISYAGSTTFDLVISAGTPQIGNGAYTTTGNTYFVDSGHANRGDSANFGTYDKPFATLNYAINRTTASNGDIIFVAPGHSETITSATELDFDVAGVRIVGLGEGTNRPTLLVDNTAAQIDIDAANITIENFYIDITATDAVVNFFDVNAANFTIKNCEILFADSGGQATNVFTLDANADNILIDRCYIHGSTDTGANEVLTMAGTAPDNVQIANSIMIGDFVNAAVYGTSTPNLAIDNSVFRNYQDGDHAIELTANATGYIRNSQIATDAFATALDPGTLEIYNVLWYDDDHPADSVGVPVFAEALSVAAVDSILAILAGTNGISAWPAATGPGVNVSMAEVLRAVYDDTNSLAGIALPTNPTANSLAAFIASGGTALGTELADSKSIVDALGTDGTTPIDAATSILGAIGVNDANNAMDTSAVADNADGSVLERLEHTQADTDKLDAVTLAVSPVAGSIARFLASGGTALGTQLADSKSIIDALGTDGTTPADTATSILGAIGVNDSNNTMGTSSVAPNADGSVFERLEALASDLIGGANSPNHLVVSVDLTSATWNTAASHEIADIVGSVEMVVIPLCTETLVDAADGASIQLGYEGVSNAIIASTGAAGAGGNTIEAGEAWVDASPADVIITTAQKEALTFSVSNNAGGTRDIGYEITGAALTDGTIEFHIYWRPLTTGATINAGAGGAL